MDIDGISIAGVGDEWGMLLIGARIDTIIQPTEHSIALQCYAPAITQRQGGQNRWLYVSAHPQLARAHLTALKPCKIASEPPVFVMLLRKYLEGARFEAIQQSRWERVVELIAGYRSAPGSEGSTHYRLIVEVMGRMSNIILCDEQGLILVILKHIRADVNRYRVIAPNIQYVPPPPQRRIVLGQSLPRLEPTTITSDQLALCAAEDTELAGGVSSQVGKKRAKTQEPNLSQLLPRNFLHSLPLLP